MGTNGRTLTDEGLGKKIKKKNTTDNLYSNLRFFSWGISFEKLILGKLKKKHIAIIKKINIIENKEIINPNDNDIQYFLEIKILKIIFNKIY